MRFGELAHFHKIPHTPYYGTADATPLYLIALHETWKWTGDRALLERHRDTAERCLDWIDQYGDLDGDGFQEYQTRSTRGLENQGWKDSGDAVVYPDGAQVAAPIALCELQGYVYDAKRRMAEVFDGAGRGEAGQRRCAARPPRSSGASTRRSGTRKRAPTASGSTRASSRSAASYRTPATVCGRASPKPERAARVVRRLMQEDMSSGWGIRTLSARHPAYNPHSYHRGSVWPHDNGIIAAGFKRYGFAEEAGRLARDIWEAVSMLRLLPPARALRRPAARRKQLPSAVPGREHPAGLGRRHSLSSAADHPGAARRRAGTTACTSTPRCRTGCPI